MNEIISAIIGIIGAVIGTVSLCVACYNWGYRNGSREKR
jgi:hypothetical protein